MSRLSLSAAIAVSLLIAAASATAQQGSLGANGAMPANPFRGQSGRHVTYICPAAVPNSDSLWGTGVYIDDSLICLAAIHAGVLKKGQSGQVTLVMGDGGESFQGSAQNGVKSQNYGRYGSSFEFDRSGEPGQIDWGTTGRSIPSDFLGSVVLVCPPTRTPAFVIYGTDVYTEDSSICMAAVHAGIISFATGGRIQMTPGGAEPSFASSTRNGITSTAYNSAWPSTFKVAAASGTPVAQQRSASSAASATTTVTGITVNVSAQGLASVSWTAVPGATGYVVVRWKTDDATCCNNLSPPGAQLTATTWLDSMLLIRLGTYGYRVYATTPGGTVTGETTVSWNGAPTSVTQVSPPASPGATTGPRVVGGTPPGTVQTTAAPPAVQTPNSPGATAGPRVVGGAPPGAVAPPPVTALPASPLANGPTATGTTVEVRYRVVLLGATVQQGTKDNPTFVDGRGDEIYGVAATVLWDRQQNQVKSRSLVRTVEYGDVGVITKAPDRLQAGNASAKGGLARGSALPDGFDPNPGAKAAASNLAANAVNANSGAGNLAAAAANAAQSNGGFPLVVWEGPLATDDLLLVVPSVWERDSVQTAFNTYRAMWLNASVDKTLASPFVTIQLPTPGLTSTTGDAQPGLPTLITLTDLGAQLIDRPIGLTPTPLIEPYHDRFVVVTKDKLAGLTSIGNVISVPINYAEPNADPILGGDYTLYLQVERTQ